MKILTPDLNHLRKLKMGAVVKFRETTFVPNYGMMANVVGHVIGFGLHPDSLEILVSVSFNGTIIKNVHPSNLIRL